MTARFLQTGRSQINGDPADGERKTAGLCRSTDTLPGFLDGSVGKTHDIKARQTVGNVAFGDHAAALDSRNRKAAHGADHNNPTFFPFYAIIPYNAEKRNPRMQFRKVGSCKIVRHLCTPEFSASTHLAVGKAWQIRQKDQDFQMFLHIFTN